MRLGVDIRRGVTLIELMVTLGLLSIMAAVVGLALHAPRPAQLVDQALEHVEAARDSALRSGQAVTVAVTRGGRLMHATAFPDGRVLADSELGVDALTGVAARAPR